MEESHVIYGLRCVCHDSEIRYVGKTECKLKKRFAEHLSAARQPHPTLAVHRWMAKHGLKNIVAEVLDRDLDPQALTLKEVYYIARYNTYRSAHGLNLTLGGEGRLQDGLNVGSTNPRATLTEQQVSDMRSLLWDGASTRVVAKMFSTPIHTVDQLAGGVSWRHVPWPADRPRVVVNHQLLSASKLTNAQVLAIKRRLTIGERGRYLAAEYGVSEATVSMIKSGITWKHVPWPEVVT